MLWLRWLDKLDLLGFMPVFWAFFAALLVAVVVTWATRDRNREFTGAAFGWRCDTHYGSGMDLARRNFAAIYVSHLATAVGMSAFLPFLPYYLTEVGVTDAAGQQLWAGVIVAAAPFMASICGPAWGALGDRLGRKIMVLRSLASIVVFVGLMGLATAPWQLLALRLLQGMFSGFVAAGNTLVSVSTPTDRQGKVLGQLQTGLFVGLAVGPLLGGVIGYAVGHRPVFLVTACLAGIAFVVVGAVAREDRSTRKPTGGVLDTIRGVGRDLAEHGRRREIRSLLASFFLFRTSLSMMLPVLPIYVLTLGDVPEAKRTLVASLLFVAVAIPYLVFAGRWGRRADQRGPGITFVVCCLLAGLCFVPYGLVGSAVALIALRVFQGIFIAGIMPAGYAAAARLSPASGRGAAMGLTQSSLQIAMAVGALSGGALVAVLDYNGLFLLSCGLLMGAGLCAWLTWARQVDGAA